MASENKKVEVPSTMPELKRQLSTKSVTILASVFEKMGGDGEKVSKKTALEYYQKVRMAGNMDESAAMIIDSFVEKDITFTQFQSLFQSWRIKQEDMDALLERVGFGTEKDEKKTKVEIPSVKPELKRQLSTKSVSILAGVFDKMGGDGEKVSKKTALEYYQKVRMAGNMDESAAMIIDSFVEETITFTQFQSLFQSWRIKQEDMEALLERVGFGTEKDAKNP